MPVISSHQDTEALTLTFVAEFAAGVERVWQLWEDPRQLERWWGPPGWPATFERHDFTVGGESRYYMTGPEGEKPSAWWTITAMEAPHRLEYDDGFVGEDGEPLTDSPPMHGTVTLEAIETGTRMTAVMAFASVEAMEEGLAMGMEEGMRLAIGQIDGLLG